MPASIIKRAGKYRIINPDGTLVRDNRKRPVDLGGYDTLREAQLKIRRLNRK